MEEKTMNEFMLDILTPLGVPVNYGWYDGIKENNITFYQYLEQYGDFMDDEMTSIVHFFQIDLWGYTNLEPLKKQVLSTLLKNDFRLVDTRDLFEVKEGLYHKAIRVRTEKLYGSN